MALNSLKAMVQINGKSKRGGARPNAGRKPGSKSRTVTRTRAIAEAAMAGGVTPLEFMLQILRDDSKLDDPKDQAAKEAMRFEAAKAAAPYIHPRLQAIEHSGSLDLISKASDDELDAMIREKSAAVGVTIQ